MIAEGGVFGPIERARLVEQLSAAARLPIALIIAPAGYGKSVVLRQYLAGLSEPVVRFSLQAEHTTLLSFLRGFAEALGERAPHATTALAGAYERNQGSPKRGGDLARWMHAHLESFTGVIAVDDLHIADDDPEVTQFVTSLIERSKGRIRWIVSSRSTAGLPVASWLAYHDADPPINEQDLRFTFDEAKNAAGELRLTISDAELRDLLELTEGWPAAMTFALQTSTRSSDLRKISAVTREMIYGFLAQQVYAGLDEDERALLEIAVALPNINVKVLERAGFDQALQIIERLRERTAFIYEESEGVYQCHDLFREFLRHQSTLGGKRAARALYERAARALEDSGDKEHAIEAYVAADLPMDVLRLLERHGFDLLERARSDVVSRAIEALDESTRRGNALILALQGAVFSIAGATRAESLLQRSITRAGDDRELAAVASLRLASILGNKGKDVAPLLRPVIDDEAQPVSYRVEALSLLAAQRAIAGDTELASILVARIEVLLGEIDSEPIRARVLHRVGIASRHIGATARAFESLRESSQIADELHLFGLASRVNAVLSNLALHEYDDADQQLLYAQRAAEAATRAGDAFALHTSLLQTLSALTRHGKPAECAAIESRFEARFDDRSRYYLSFFRAVRLAWETKFSEAHQLMSSCWDKLHSELDRVHAGSQCALFLALDGGSEECTEVVRAVMELARGLKTETLFGKRALWLSLAYCALAETLSGRHTRGLQILGSVPVDDRISRAARDILSGFTREVRNLGDKPAEVDSGIRALASAGYLDSALIFDACRQRLKSWPLSAARHGGLTPSELTVLRMLAEGFTRKEIAIETKRSANTVRNHIANAIWKLNCQGEADAVRKARRLQLF